MSTSDNSSQKNYYYFSSHDLEGGWGVKNENGEVVALCYNQGYAAIIAHLLNTHTKISVLEALKIQSLLRDR